MSITASKQTVGWGCVLLTLVGLWGTHQLTAQEQNALPTAPTQQRTTEAAAERIERILSQPLKTSLYYEAERLNLVLDAIADEYEIPIVFDKAALDEVAISPESEVSIRLENISLRSALNIMFREPGIEDLTYTIDDEVLLITTEERANEKMLVRVYRIDEFELTNEAQRNALLGASAWADYNPFIGMLTSCVEPKSWKENGTGDGAVQLVRPGMLVVTQARHVHEQIEVLIARLRSKKQEVIADAKSKVSPSKPMTLGFVINIAVGDDSQQTQKQLATAIKKSVEWSSGNLAADDAWIEVLPGRVLVRHLPKVLLQVETTLLNMRVLHNTVIGGHSAGGGGLGGGGGFF